MRKALKLSSLFFATLLVSGATELDAQVNIAIGYKTGITDFAVNNRLLTAFMPATGELQKPFDALKFLHGIELGLRYRLSNWGLEAGWENLSRDRSAVTFNPVNETFSTREYNYSISALKFGIDNYIGSFAVGASLHWRTVSINRVIDNNDLSIVNDRKATLQFHVLWLIQQSDYVAFGLKPYIQTSLDPYDLTPLATDLGVAVPGFPDNRDKLSMWGISFVFYNGRQ